MQRYYCVCVLLARGTFQERSAILSSHKTSHVQRGFCFPSALMLMSLVISETSCIQLAPMQRTKLGVSILCITPSSIEPTVCSNIYRLKMQHLFSNNIMTHIIRYWRGSWRIGSWRVKTLFCQFHIILVYRFRPKLMDTLVLDKPFGKGWDGSNDGKKPRGEFVFRS